MNFKQWPSEPAQRVDKRLKARGLNFWRSTLRVASLHAGLEVVGLGAKA
jgi:hypothetical protein